MSYNRFDGPWYVRIFKVCVALVGAYLLVVILFFGGALLKEFWSAFSK